MIARARSVSPSTQSAQTPGVQKERVEGECLYQKEGTRGGWRKPRNEYLHELYPPSTDNSFIRTRTVTRKGHGKIVEIILETHKKFGLKIQSKKYEKTRKSRDESCTQMALFSIYKRNIE